MRLDALGQQTPHTLPYGERFKIGGERLGRGFEVAEIAGDEGIGAKVELRRGLRRRARAPPRRISVRLLRHRRGVQTGRAGARVGRHGGLRLRGSGRRVSSIIELAKPLTHPDVEGRKELALFAELRCCSSAWSKIAAMKLASVHYRGRDLVVAELARRRARRHRVVAGAAGDVRPSTCSTSSAAASRCAAERSPTRSSKIRGDESVARIPDCGRDAGTRPCAVPARSARSR